MTDIHECPSCARERRPEHFICDTCITTINDTLDQLDWYTEQLEITTSRQKGIDYRTLGGSPSSVTKIPYHATAVEAQRALNAAAKLNYDPTNSRVAANWELLTRAVTKAEKIIDRPEDKWFAGPCGTTLDDGQECDVDLYATAAVGNVTCTRCEAVHDVSARRDALLKAAEDRLADATTLARYVTFLSGFELRADRVRQWATRKRLVAKGHDRSGRPTYRIGDALDLLQKDTSTAA